MVPQPYITIEPTKNGIILVVTVTGWGDTLRYHTFKPHVGKSASPMGAFG